MKSLDRFEREVLGAHEKGILVSARPTKSQIATFREAARATFVKNRRVNIRLSASDLMDLQARAYEEGVPYKTRSTVCYTSTSQAVCAKRSHV